MIYRMKLQDNPFQKIKNQTKTIELRLFDEKRKKIQPGDLIEFTNLSNSEVITVEVLKLHLFDSFKKLYEKFDKISLGYNKDEKSNPNDMEQYYSEDDIKKYGVVGIEIKLINNVNRIDKNNYYLNISETALERSTCLRKKWGAIIVKNDEIISTGYNGAPRKRKNCDDLGYCIRESLNIPRGERYEMCRSVHAEQNAIISASRKDMLDGTLYMVGIDSKTQEYVDKSMPCSMCKRVIINSGIKKIIIRDSKTSYRTILTQELIENDESLEGGRGY